MKPIAAIVLLATVPALLAGVAHPRPPAWSSTTPPEGAVTMATIGAWPVAPQWIDARSAADFAHGHAPGAQPLSLATWDRDIEAVLAAWSPDRPVVVYCDDRPCQEGRHVAEVLRRDYGLPQVWTLHGGWAAWRAQGSR